MGKLSRIDASNGNRAVASAAAEPFADWTPRRVVTATLILLAVGAGFFLLFRFYTVVFLFLVALMLGVATKPTVGWLQKRGIRSEIGVILVYLALLALIALFLVLVAPLIADQATSVVDRLPQYYGDVRQALIESNNRFVQRLALGLPGTLSFSLGSLGAAAAPVGSAAEAAAASFGAVFQFVGAAAKAIFVIIAILALAFFWVQEGEVLIRKVLLLLPPERRDPARELYGEMEGKVAAYFRGQIILSGVVGILSLIAYVAIGLPYALGLALIMAVCEAIPMIGPTIGAVPTLLVTLAVAPDKVIWALLVIFIIQTAENNLLAPRVMDRSVGINPIITILGLSAFGALFGFAGAVLAIPLTAMVQIVATRLMFRAPAAPEVGRTKTSMLRLATQELIQDVRKSSRAEVDETLLVDPEVERAEDLLEAIAVDLDRLLTDADEPAAEEGALA
jgi:predicted PurR-regulated permease PerM